MIRLRFCTIEYTPEGCTTTFDDGASVDATPHPQDYHYRALCHRLGYQDDALAYCREHDVAHSLVAQWLSGKPSAVLWAKAHGTEPSYAETIMEEIAAQVHQRWWRANERPIIGDCPWDFWKAEALSLLAREPSL